MMSSVTGGCPLALVILLLVCIDPTATDVVKSVSDCAQFFLGNTPPEIKDKLENGNIHNQNRYKPICQKYGKSGETMRFMTLYDTENKIPVFSAYKYTGHETCKKEYWRIELKLDKKEQAKDDDYKNNDRSCERGHMFPCLLANTKEDMLSTYTLTNAVPQVASFNKNSWKNLEANLKCFMDTHCKNLAGKLEAYLVTGAIPSTDNTLKNGVNVPATLWTAFCCYNHEEDQWYAGAYSGDNIEEGTVKNINIVDLFEEIGVDPFPNQCDNPKVHHFEKPAGGRKRLREDSNVQN